MKRWLFGLALLSTQAFGWGDVGHESVGALAEKHLDRNGKALQGYLLHIPLSVAATFPDHVRDEEIFKGYDDYHYVRVPFGLTIAQALKLPINDVRAHAVLTRGVEKISDPQYSKQLRALWLKYVIHVVGDVQQPFHISHPEDLGANRCKVYALTPATAKRVEEAPADKKVELAIALRTESNLHTFWDTTVFEWLKEEIRLQQIAAGGTPTSKYWFGHPQVVEAAEKLAASMAVDWSAAAAAPITTWYDEAFAFHKDGYPDDIAGTKPVVAEVGETPAIAPKDRKYCAVGDHQVQPNDIPILDTKYGMKTLQIAKRQVYLGGRRLAHLMNQMGARLRENLQKKVDDKVKGAKEELAAFDGAYDAYTKDVLHNAHAGFLH